MNCDEDFVLCIVVVYVLLSHSGAQPRRMQSSADATGSPNDNEYVPPRQPKHSGRQTQGSAANEGWRRKHQHCAEVSTVDETSSECRSATGSQSAHCNLQSATGRPETRTSGQKKGPGKRKTLNDETSTSVQHTHTCSTPAGPSSQSPSMPQSASFSHQVPQSTSTSARKLIHTVQSLLLFCVV